ncbi:MAG: AmmeMemoRadiSam system protein B [Zavarzinella sp.]
MLLDSIPVLRPGLRPVLADEPGKVVLLDDFRIGSAMQLSRAAFDIVRLIDGKKNINQIRAEASKLFEGQEVPLETIQNILVGLEQATFLDTPALRNRITQADRPPACLGVYDADPDKAAKQLKKLFGGSHGPGLPAESGCRVDEEGAVRAVLVPHMDYQRGGTTYGHGFKELVERTTADIFVIVATSHYSSHRFTLSRQNFITPFGTVPADQQYINSIVEHFGDGLFDDPFAHVPEHSIELEVVMLQYLYQLRKPIRIVPLLVGSFFDCVERKATPRDQDDVFRMIQALRQAEQEAGGNVVYLISGDLAHIGPKFDDPDLVSDEQLLHSRTQDEKLLHRLEVADTDGYFRVIAEEEDCRRICGLPPTYVALEAARARTGKILNYHRFVHADGFESVSFASAAFT